MINIDLNALNAYEKKLHEKLVEFGTKDKKITISQASEICLCSISKISKFVRKLGFSDFKSYASYIIGSPVLENNLSTELDRIKNYINDFNYTIIDKLYEEILKHDKIILFGYGPSYICAQYVEYKLRFILNKIVVAVGDEFAAKKLLSDNSLLLVITTTGEFMSFESLMTYSKEVNSSFLMLIEEYNLKVLEYCENVYFLTNNTQSTVNMPYHKTRTIFFIFFEELIKKFLENKM